MSIKVPSQVDYLGKKIGQGSVSEIWFWPENLKYSSQQVLESE